MMLPDLPKVLVFLEGYFFKVIFQIKVTIPDWKKITGTKLAPNRH